MMIQSFDPSRFSGYGIAGQETAKKMVNALEAHSLSITYNADNKKFTLHNTSEIDKEALEKIFLEATYIHWQPQILDETDESGNRLVRLRYVALPSNHSGVQMINITASPSFTFRGSRDAAAEEVVYNIKKHLGISFTGKTCLDVGCRSGENTIAIAKAGATVIGIDPNDREFETAKIKGIASENLVKATLQDYHAQFPDQQFDIITLFLWNIPILQQEGVGAALARLIRPEGTVIISYGDEAYDDPYVGVPKFANKFFGNVVKFNLQGWNPYILKCSKPKI